MNKRWIAVTLCAVAVAAIAAMVLQSPWYERKMHLPVFIVPKADEIAELHATLFQFRGGIGEDIPEFKILETDVPSILERLEPAQYCRDSKPVFESDHFGKLRFVTKSGSLIIIDLYWWGVNPVVFSQNGRDFFTGRSEFNEAAQHGIDGGIKMCIAIANAHKSAIGQKLKDQ